jgi:hypothetical protein
MKLGIIQPGRLGDIIILLPAMKYLADKGYKVYWPIFKQYAWMFEHTIDYVNFIPITNDIYNCVGESYKVLSELGITDIKDVAATFPGSRATDAYVAAGDGLVQPFDVFKYNRLAVPIDEKWKLELARDHEAESKLYDELVKEDKYALVNLNHSKGRIDCRIEYGGQIIETNDSHNIFHWIKIIENASVIAVVDSSLANLIEQLNISCKKTLFKKADSRLPSIRNKWDIL